MRAETRKVSELSARLEGLARGLPKIDDLLALPGQRLDHASQRLGLGLGAAAGAKRAHFERVAAGLSLRPIASSLAQGRNRTNELAGRAVQAQRRHFGDLGGRLAQAGRLLDSYSYQGVLERGFALVRDAAGSPVRSSDGITVGEALELEFSKGDRLAVTASKSGSQQGEPRVSAKKPTGPSKPKNVNQGQLF